MLKNKSIDYILGMITGISVSITFWACTNTDLIASNDTSGESNAVQEVKITNWSSMPDVSLDAIKSVFVQAQKVMDTDIPVIIPSM
jgi:hypothetical protein